MDLTRALEESSAPTLPPEAFDRVRAALDQGPLAAVDTLIAELRQAEDFNNLFYALLLKKRVELGVSPFPTGPASELPPETHEPYEQAIREAGRHVGQLYLDRGNFPKAWAFFRMLNEPEQVQQALESYTPGESDDISPFIEIAWQNGLLPKKGFDLILERHGICSAITTVSSSDLNNNPDLRDHCVARLIRSLHEQLSERLRSDLEGRGMTVPASTSITEMVRMHPELFAEDAYHVDTSHLSSVVQMSLYMPKGPELEKARDLCEYGKRLAPGLKGHGEAPFEETFDDYLAFLDVVAGVNVDANLARFREKAARESAEGSSYSSQVFVNLLVRAGREQDALAAAREFLIAENEQNLICPGVTELARRVGNFEAISEAGQARSDGVQFLSGLLAARK